MNEFCANILKSDRVIKLISIFSNLGPLNTVDFRGGELNFDFGFSRSANFCLVYPSNMENKLSFPMTVVLFPAGWGYRYHLNYSVN